MDSTYRHKGQAVLDVVMSIHKRFPSLSVVVCDTRLLDNLPRQYIRQYIDNINHYVRQMHHCTTIRCIQLDNDNIMKRRAAAIGQENKSCHDADADSDANVS